MNYKDEAVNEALIRAKAEIELLQKQNASLTRDVEHVKNLNIRDSIKLLLRAVYRSLRFRALKLIWGSAAGYKDTDALQAAAAAPLHDMRDVRKVLTAIDEADATNAPLLFRVSPIRRSIYELLRKLVIGARKVFGSGGGE